jgi:hypothetical protein
MLKRLCAILTIILSISPLAAQEVEWSVDATMMLNNREGGDEYTRAQTFIFTRLAPEVGVSLNDGAHVLKGGAVWYQPMTDEMSGFKILPTLYYRYNSDNGWHVTAGMFPRSLMVQRAPRYMWSDSLDYCQPNMRGTMAQFIKPAGYAELAVDWRQIPTDVRREAFTFMVNTDWRVAGPFRLGGHLQYSHLAMSHVGKEHQHVTDDMLINPMLGLDLSHRTVLDSLRFDIGALITMERDRGDMEWLNNAGLLATATARWRWLQLDETFYTGKGLMPLYPQHGSQLNLGDPYFNNKVYSRTDLIGHIVSNQYVDLSVSLTYHITDKVTGFWQQLSCRFYLDNRLWKAAKAKH